MRTAIQQRIQPQWHKWKGMPVEYTLQVIMPRQEQEDYARLLLHSSRTPIFPCIVPNAPFQGLWIPCYCWYLYQKWPIVSTQGPATTALVEPCGMDQSPTCDPYHRHRFFFNPYTNRYFHLCTMGMQCHLHQQKPTFMLPPARIYPNWSRPIRYLNTHKGYRVE